MVLARVIGTVVASGNSDGVEGGRYLLVEPTDLTGEPDGSVLLALDAIRSNRGDLVLVSQGSSCRQTAETKDRAVDALVVGIVDTVDTGEDDGERVAH